MSLYKIMSDEETSVVLIVSCGSWKACATFPSVEAANLFITREERRDSMKELSHALTRIGNGQDVDRARVRMLCHEFLRALDHEDVALALLQGEREEDAA